MIPANTVLEIFAEQVREHPNKLALKFKDTELSYKQLDEVSNRIANFLISKGVTNETLVPICVHSPLDMVTGIWGIIKAGAAYVPIDSEFPEDRIKYMVDDTKARLVLSDSKTTRFLEAAKDTEVIFADNHWEIVNDSPSFAPGIKVTKEDAVYVIYTSGSTGNPKGVLIEHGSLSSYVEGLLNKLPYHECRSFALGISFAADFVNTILFGSLLSGKELHLFLKEDYNNVEYIHQYFNEHSIDVAKIVPSHWKSLSLNGQELLPEKIMMFGGEPLYTAMLKDVLPAANRTCMLVNHYGPTETTVGQLINIVDDKKEYGHIIPIGKPFTGASIYILDEEGNPVEGDNIGEIFIGGNCVARGYLNRPDLTGQRFIPNKFSRAKGERLYRTGDLARFLPDGDVEYLGRIDDQVKIRGYRIELGEIENVLGKAPGVKQAAVLAKMGTNNDMRLIAYVVCPNGYDKSAIVSYLEAKLPQYMVPQLIVPMDAFPHFPNGKLDKKALPNPDASTLLVNEYVAPVNKTETIISNLWKEILDVHRAGSEDNFFELGGNSLLGLKFITQLKTHHSLKLPVAKLYQYPKIADLAAFLDGKAAVKKIKKRSKTANADVAIIGMAGRFPGANSIAEFWDNLKNGRETVSFFSDEELHPSISPNLRNNPNYVKARGIISDVKGFDAAFFGIPPKSAELMDPQQRIFLEIAWEALENTGYAPSKYEGSIGVFAGVRVNTYYANNVIPNDELIENIGRFQIITLNDKDYVATRTAYAFDLKGPAVNVQSACSTSLLAVAQAVQSIRSGQCDMALAGGATINAPVNIGHLYNEGAMLSDDGHCRPFDAEAKGTIFSDGAGVVLLKNKDEAIKDGDNIIAVIKGVGLSNDGSAKGSFTAPSAEGQAAAISMAIDDAGVDPADISYVESHGTATPLGDPIEIEGLNIAFGDQEKKQYCAIGSVKSNFGHLTAASGVAGLIKAALALHCKQIPPSINYNKPNPHIDFENSPFFVNNKLSDWSSDKERIAGVSSFGVGGTNVHVVLTEAGKQPVVETPSSRPAQLICWSAKAEKSLDLFADKLTDYFNININTNLADVAFTLNTTREDFNHRRFIVVSDVNDLIQKITSAGQNTKTIKDKSQSIVFMFPGQGDQYLNMGKALYNTERVFKEAMDECAAILKAHLKENILDVIYPKAVTPEAEEKLRNTAFSQPALFTIGYALGKLWMSWGIFPTAFVGHSVGEFVSAYFSGVFSLEDGLKLIATRGKLMSGLPGGSMLSVRLPAEEIQPYLSTDIALAAANSPQLCVVAGADESINELSDKLTEKGILNRLLPTSHAFHSHMMDDVVAPFEVVVKSVKLHEPLIPITSTVTGERLKPEDATDPHYWAKHLRSTVLFGKAVQKLIDEGHNLFLELGPANSASTLTRQQAAGKPITVISTLDKSDTTDVSYQSVLKALGQLWLNGIEPDWKLFYKEETRRRLANLPAYAFNKQDYWVEPPVRQQLTSPFLAINAQPIHTPANTNLSPVMRKQELIRKVTETLENASGIELGNVEPDVSFIEMGLDSLLLTQVALQLKKQFSLPITFRQLNEELGTLDLLAGYLDEKLPPDAFQTHAVQQPHHVSTPIAMQQLNGSNTTALDLISQQIQLLAMQVSLLQNGQVQPAQQAPVYANDGATAPKPVAVKPVAEKPNSTTPELSAEEHAEIKKPFGAIARIEKQSAALTDAQQKYLANFIEKYNEKTQKSKAYTQEARPYMADPRVVSGFRPATKELVYSIVIEKSKGSRFWDIDGNEYIDALNGFGSNMLGYQPDFIADALKKQIDKGYEIGPQHVLAAEVCKLVCEFTNFDRSALCNTGSEAVLGAMRIARTVTGRSIIVAFAGSYHGITDEVIARGSKKMKTYPAAPGIMLEAVQNILILDYGTDESLQIIKERGDEIAAVLVEPVQSRNADFQPIEYLKKLRALTKETQSVLIFDEVISGFRFHPAGVQGMWGIKADLGTYGKVAGGGMSVGIIAGERRFMDSLDGGFWQYGDNSIPEVGVTYFAGTFVRHPLVLAATKASLLYLKEQGPELQENLNAKTAYIAKTINGMFRRLKIPMFVASYGSLYRIKFYEEYPYLELFFALMRYKGIHLLEGFPCYLTTAHSDADIQKILICFEESLTELKEVGLIPDYEHLAVDENESLNTPPVPGAKLGKDNEGNPAWFIKDEKNPGRYLQVSD